MSSNICLLSASWWLAGAASAFVGAGGCIPGYVCGSNSFESLMMLMVTRFSQLSLSNQHGRKYDIDADAFQMCMHTSSVALRS